MEDKMFHEYCFACGRYSIDGLKLRYNLLDDGSLYSELEIGGKYQGYDNSSHGGIIATILVSSMINLFHVKYGLKLNTARLNVRYKRRVPVDKKVKVISVEQDKLRNFYRAKSQMILDDIVCSEAEGCFKSDL